MKMSDQKRWAERSVCCNRIHPRGPDPQKHCQYWCSTFGGKMPERENAIGCTVKITASWILTSRYLEPLKSSEVSGIQWARYQQLMGLDFQFIGGSDHGEVSNLKSPQAVFLYSVLYNEGEGNRMRKACSRTPVMERYTMSSKVGGNVGRLEEVENWWMQCTMKKFTHSNAVEVQSLGK